MIFLIFFFLLSKTRTGRHIYAIGSNERTARLSGIHVERVKTWIYILMGALVAVTAVIQVAPSEIRRLASRWAGVMR